MCSALVRPLFKLTAIYVKEILTGILEGFALLRICCRNTHEVTCDIYDTFSPSLPSSATVYVSSCLCLGCHQGSPKHPASRPHLTVPPSPPSITLGSGSGL